MPARVTDAMSDIMQLASELQDAPQDKSNNVPVLLQVVQRSGDEADLHAALRGLGAFFDHAYEQGHLSAAKRKASSPGGAAAVYRDWLARQHREYVAALTALLQREAPQDAQVLAVSRLMEAVRGPTPGDFEVQHFHSLLAALLTSAHASPRALAAFLGSFLQLADVRLYALRAAAAVCETRAEARGREGNGRYAEEGAALRERGVRNGERAAWQLGDADVARNVYDLLARVEPEFEVDEGASLESWTGAAEAGVAVAAVGGTERSRERRKRRREEVGVPGRGAEGGVHVAWANAKAQKKAFSAAWLALLRMPLPDDIYRKVLLGAPDKLIPHLSNPLMLADFLSWALRRGGLIGILALNSIFVLVTRHGFEYPRFYQQLYLLLTPAAFKAKYRACFFQLADIFLASGMVPAYSAAAFAKRFARLALTSPPGGAMVATAFVHNILRRHPACAVLLHRPAQRAAAANVDGAAAAPLSGDAEDDFELGDGDKGGATATAPGVEAGGDGAAGGAAGGGGAAGAGGALGAGEDPYDDSCDDPAYSRAIESSLWEVEALRQHYCPEVAAFASVLDKDFAARKGTAEVDIQPLLHASYGSMVEGALAKKTRSVAVAHYVQPPMRLYDTNATDDFGGWQLQASA